MGDAAVETELHFVPVGRVSAERQNKAYCYLRDLWEVHCSSSLTSGVFLSYSM